MTNATNGKPEPSLNDREFRIVRATINGLLIASLAYFLIVIYVAWSATEAKASIWNFLLVPPAGLALGAFCGFLYAAIKDELERLKSFIAVVQTLLGGIVAYDAALASDGNIAKLVRSVKSACGDSISSGMVLVTFIGFAALGMMTLYFMRLTLLNPLIAKGKDLLGGIDEIKSFFSLGAGGKPPKVGGRNEEQEPPPESPDAATATGEHPPKAPKKDHPGGKVDVSTGRDIEPMPKSKVKPKHDPDDPQKGKWGGEPKSASRELSASVRETGTADLFRVYLRLSKTTKDAPPIVGPVRFHLHPTFRQQVVTVPTDGEQADLVLIAWGAFTVGVESDNGTTRLELDLSKLPGAPELFKSR